MMNFLIFLFVFKPTSPVDLSLNIKKIRNQLKLSGNVPNHSTFNILKPHRSPRAGTLLFDTILSSPHFEFFLSLYLGNIIQNVY